MTMPQAGEAVPQRKRSHSDAFSDDTVDDDADSQPSPSPPPSPQPPASDDDEELRQVAMEAVISQQQNNDSAPVSQRTAAMRDELSPAAILKLYDENGVDMFTKMSYNLWSENVARLSNAEIKDLIRLFYEFVGGSDIGDANDTSPRLYPPDASNDPLRIEFLRTFYELHYLYLNSMIDFRKSDYVADSEASIIPERASESLDITEEEIGQLAVIWTRINVFAEIAKQMNILRGTYESHFHPAYAFHNVHWAVSRPDFVTLAPITQATLYIMHRAILDQVRLVVRCGQRHRLVYMPRMYNNMYTHTYVPFRYVKGGIPLDDEKDVEQESTLPKYIRYLAGNPIDNKAAHDILHQQASLMSTVIDDFNSDCNSAMPRYDPCRSVFAFTNGVYDARTDRFYLHNELNFDPDVDCEISGFRRSDNNLTACKFFEQEVDSFENLRGAFYPNGAVADCDEKLDDAADDWFKIPTPLFDKIFRTQITNNATATWKTENPELVLRFMWPFLGRLLFDVGQFDNHQRTLFIVGGSKSGKSAIVDILSRIYPASMVRTAGDQFEERFGLSSLYGGYLWVIRDCGKTARFNLSDFLSITTGEDVSIMVKHETAFTARWKSPGIVVGNEFFQWNDQSRFGAIARRLIYFNFRNAVPQRDNELIHKVVTQELPNIIVKMTRGYHALNRYMAENNISEIDQIWPQYYTDCIDSLTQSRDSLQAFLDSGMFRFLQISEPTALRAKFAMTWTEFKSQYRNFCNENTEFGKAAELNINHLPDAFRDRGIWSDTVRRVPEQPNDPDAVIAEFRRNGGGPAAPRRGRPGAANAGGIAVLYGIIKLRAPLIGAVAPQDAAAPQQAPGFVSVPAAPPRPPIQLPRAAACMGSNYMNDHLAADVLDKYDNCLTPADPNTRIRKIKPSVTSDEIRDLKQAIDKLVDDQGVSPGERRRLRDAAVYLEDELMKR